MHALHVVYVCRWRCIASATLFPFWHPPIPRIRLWRIRRFLLQIRFHTQTPSARSHTAGVSFHSLQNHYSTFFTCMSSLFRNSYDGMLYESHFPLKARATDNDFLIVLHLQYSKEQKRTVKMVGNGRQQRKRKSPNQSIFIFKLICFHFLAMASPS